MSTESKKSILTMGNGKMICKYCGNQISEINKSSSNSHYYDDEWTEYECECDIWKQYEQMNNELDILNSNMYQYFCKYQRQRRDVIEKYHKLTKNKLEINDERHKLRMQ